MTDETWLQIGVAAELSRHYQSDAREFFQLLVLLLEGTLPVETVVERRGGLFGKKKPFRVTVTLDDFQYTLEDMPRGLLATRCHTVRGIALKTEDITVREWIEALSIALENQARSGEAARSALAKWLK